MKIIAAMRVMTKVATETETVDASKVITAVGPI